MLENHKTITPSDAIISGKTVLKAGKVFMMLGQAGIGKTQIARQIANELGVDKFLEFNGQTRQPWDIMGTPDHITDDNGHRYTDWLPHKEFAELMNAKQPCIFIDELFMADGTMQNSLNTLMLEKQAGTLKLPSHTYIIVASNRSEDGCLINEPSQATMDRVISFEVVPSAEDLEDFAVRSNWHPEVIAGIRRFPLWVTEGFNGDLYKSCTPRGLNTLSDLCFQGIPSKIEIPLVQGIVGHGVATEFVAFRRVFNDLPDRDEIYKNPTTAPVPSAERPDVLYALASLLGQKADENNVDATLQYASRMPKEFETMIIVDTLKANPDLMKVKTVKSWLLDPKNIEIATTLSV